MDDAAMSNIQPVDLSAPMPRYVPRRSSGQAVFAAEASRILARIGLHWLSARVYRWGWRQDGWEAPLYSLSYEGRRLALWSIIERTAAYGVLQEWGGCQRYDGSPTSQS